MNGEGHADADADADAVTVPDMPWIVLTKKKRGAARVVLLVHCPQSNRPFPSLSSPFIRPLPDPPATTSAPEIAGRDDAPAWACRSSC